MSDDTTSDTSAEPPADGLTTEFLRELIDQVLEVLEETDADAEQLAGLEDARDTLMTTTRAQKTTAEGPSLAEQIDELEAEIEEHTVHKSVIRRVLAAHGLSDDQVDSLLMDMEAVSEQLRAGNEDQDATAE